MTNSFESHSAELPEVPDFVSNESSEEKPKQGLSTRTYETRKILIGPILNAYGPDGRKIINNEINLPKNS